MKNKLTNEQFLTAARTLLRAIEKAETVEQAEGFAMALALVVEDQGVDMTDFHEWVETSREIQAETGREIQAEELGS